MAVPSGARCRADYGAALPAVAVSPEKPRSSSGKINTQRGQLRNGKNLHHPYEITKHFLKTPSMRCLSRPGSPTQQLELGKENFAVLPPEPAVLDGEPKHAQDHSRELELHESARYPEGSPNLILKSKTARS